jgi:hypothetical protein
MYEEHTFKLCPRNAWSSNAPITKPRASLPAGQGATVISAQMGQPDETIENDAEENIWT